MVSWQNNGLTSVKLHIKMGGGVSSPIVRNRIRSTLVSRHMRYEIREIDKPHSENTGLLIVLVMILCFAAVRMNGIYGFLIFPDEPAYWSYAAFAAGYDWSDITSLGSYFSYGYAFILFPIFVLCRDAVMAYRIAVGLNYALLIAAYVLLTRIMRKMLPDTAMPVGLFCAAVILVPWNLFYAQMTLTETLLIFLHVAIGNLLYCYLEKNRLSTLILLMLMLTYTYTVHMRTVGILLSAVCVLICHIVSRREQRWHLWVTAGMAAGLLVLATLLKKYALVHVYGGIDPALAADNDYGGQIAKLGYLCTWEGFYDFAITALGGILYLGMATFGLFYWGIYALACCAVRLFGEWRHKTVPGAAVSLSDTAEKNWVELSAFMLLSVAAQIVIATIYLTGRGEVDDYTYGRYSELLVPFVMVMGFAALWRARSRMVCIVTGICAAVHAAGLWLVVRQICHKGSEEFLGYFMVGISYLYDEAGYSVGRFYAGAWVICELLTLTTVASLLFCRSRPPGRGVRNTWATALFLLMAVIQMALAVHADDLYLVPFKNAAFRDARLTEKIETLAGEDRSVIYMDNGERAFIGIIQFMAREMEIEVIKRQAVPAEQGNGREDSDILIFAYDDRALADWSVCYDHTDIYGHFALVYNDL